MSSAIAPYRSHVPPGRDGFLQLLRAEWIKFRTVRGWVVSVLVTALLIIVFAVLTGASSARHGHGARPAVPIGSGGGPVTDSFYFVPQPLTGNGSITTSVNSLQDTTPAGAPGQQSGLAPWAKAGLVMKACIGQGPYAAIMVTGSHGVRMQYNYVNDRGGLPGRVSAASARWLRLARSGDTVAGYDSADGTHWSKVGSVRLAGLRPGTVAGLFVASPPSVQGGGTAPTAATAIFGAPRLEGQWPRGTWIGGQVGAGSPSFSGYPPPVTGGFARSGGEITVTGAGDIAPAVREALAGGGVIGDLLVGTFAALIAVIVVAVMFIAREYQLGLIHTTLTASPRRGRVLIAKAIVLGIVSFVAGLAGTVVAVPVGERLARDRGMYLFPVTSSAQVRLEIGTAALIAAAAVLALAAGALFRRTSGAVAAVIAAIVLPYVLVATPFLPAVAAEWLTRVTPAAAFATQQTLQPYPQVDSIYTPANGYYPLAPWAGLAVLGGYALLTLGLAIVWLRRRDA